MVLFLYTIMLVNVRRTDGEPYLHRQAGAALARRVPLPRRRRRAIVVLANERPRGRRAAGGSREALATTVTRTVTETVDGKTVKTPVTEQVAGNSQAVGWMLYRDYLLPFEVASVFLLVAMIGAVVLGKRTMERFD